MLPLYSIAGAKACVLPIITPGTQQVCSHNSSMIRPGQLSITLKRHPITEGSANENRRLVGCNNCLEQKSDLTMEKHRVMRLKATKIL